MLASYLEAAELELQVLLLVEQLLQAIGEDDVRVVEAAILLIELVVLVVLHARRHTVVGHGCRCGSLVVNAAASLDKVIGCSRFVHRRPISRKIENKGVSYMTWVVWVEKRSEN